jgi:hypothetical protein
MKVAVIKFELAKKLNGANALAKASAFVSFANLAVPVNAR